MADYRRVQAPPLAGPVPLQPAPIPSDTYAPPARPPIDHNLENLANALGGFNVSLLAYGKKNQGKDRETAEAIANRTIAGNTNEQYIKATKDGNLPVYGNPFARAVYDKHLGSVYADQTKSRVLEAIGKGEINLQDGNTNIDQIITQYANEDLKSIDGLASSKVGYAGYKEGIDTFRQSMLQKQHEEFAKAHVERMNSVAFGQFNRVFDTFQGADPAVTQNFVRGLYRDIGPGSAANIPRNQLDQQLMNVVKNKAADPHSVEDALHVLSADRKDENGNPLPPLGKNPKLLAEVQETSKIATATLTKKYDDDTKQRAIGVASEALKRQDGSWWHLTDTSYVNPVSGERKTVLADDIKKQAVTDTLTWSKITSADRKETPAARFEREWQIFSKADIPQPEWKDTLEGAAKAFTDPQSLTNPASRDQATNAAHLYMAIAERNYPYLKGTLKLDEKSRDFYTVYDVVRNQMGLSDDKALDFAAQAGRTPDNENDLAVRRVQAKEVADKVRSSNFANWYNVIYGGNVENQGAVQKRVMDIASVLTRVPGTTVEGAVDQAMKFVQSRSMYINGQVLPDTGYVPPPELKPVIEGMLDDYAKQHGKEFGVTSGSDLSVVPNGGSTFRIVKKNDGFALPLYVKIKDENDQEKVVPATITMPMVHKRVDENTSKDAAEVQRKQQEKMDLIQKGKPSETFAPHKLLQEGFKKLGINIDLLGGARREEQNRSDENSARQSNFNAARKDMKLSPQEEQLYQRHLTNLYGPGGVNNPPDKDNPKGSRSTLFQATVEHGGKFYLIPTVWNGKKLPVSDAVKLVRSEGWSNFPSYNSVDAAEKRYQRMHSYMERDTQRYFNQQ